MLDGLVSNRDAALLQLIKEIRLLYRSRPFTKSTPFNITTPDGAFVPIWLPKNSYFEIGVVVIRSDTAGQDIALCDGNASNPVHFVMPPTSEYRVDVLLPGYRSLSYNNAQLGIVNQTGGAGEQFKGEILGWEVTDQGFYR